MTGGYADFFVRKYSKINLPVYSVSGKFNLPLLQNKGDLDKMYPPKFRRAKLMNSKDILLQVIREFYVDGLPKEIRPRKGHFVEKIGNATVIKDQSGGKWRPEAGARVL